MSECVVWTGPFSRADGYGRDGGKMAHRVAYERERGPIPSGLVIDHLCRNRLCVNTAHMEAVTNRENIMRGVGVGVANAARTECVNGHPFDPANTRIEKDGERSCRTCNRAAVARYKARRRSKP